MASASGSNGEGRGVAFGSNPGVDCSVGTEDWLEGPFEWFWGGVGMAAGFGEGCGAASGFGEGFGVAAGFGVTGSCGVAARSGPKDTGGPSGFGVLAPPSRRRAR